MRVFYAPDTADHQPEFFLVRGRVAPNEERAPRAERLLEAVGRLGLEPEEPTPAPQAALARVHTPRYLAFLDTAWQAFQALPDAGREVVANVQPRQAGARYPAGIVGRAGWHMGDCACPIGERTGSAIRRSADTAVAAARAVAEGGPTAYALCRPPGHHASAEVAAGHCYLNNSAIAAAELAAHGARPAVLDIDVHHGNGTQAIFFERADVLTVSVHADPARFYPWFVGYAEEVGVGAGEGYNRNLPLAMATKDDAWLAAIEDALAEIARFGADAVVLALGFDAHVSDPLSGLAVSTEGFARAGALIGRVPHPVVVIQEGGYLAPPLTDNAEAFFRAYLGARPI